MWFVRCYFKLSYDSHVILTLKNSVVTVSKTNGAILVAKVFGLLWSNCSNPVGTSVFLNLSTFSPHKSDVWIIYMSHISQSIFHQHCAPIAVISCHFTPDGGWGWGWGVGGLYQQGSALFPALIRKHTPSKYEMKCTVEVWERMSNFFPHFIVDMITYPCWG